LETKRDIGWSLSHLGEVAGAQGDYAAAHEFFEESLETLRELGFKTGVGRLLERFAILAAAQGQAERAVRLLGAAEASRTALDADWWWPLTRGWFPWELDSI